MLRFQEPFLVGIMKTVEAFSPFEQGLGRWVGTNFHVCPFPSSLGHGLAAVQLQNSKLSLYDSNKI